MDNVFLNQSGQILDDIKPVRAVTDLEDRHSMGLQRFFYLFYQLFLDKGKHSFYIIVHGNGQFCLNFRCVQLNPNFIQFHKPPNQNLVLKIQVSDASTMRIHRTP